MYSMKLEKSQTVRQILGSISIVLDSQSQSKISYPKDLRLARYFIIIRRFIFPPQDKVKFIYSDFISFSLRCGARMYEKCTH